MNRESIQCGDFLAAVRWDGSAYGSTFYTVSVVVASLAEAQSRTDTIREAVKRERPTWAVASDVVRLKSRDWHENPVRIELSYVDKEG